MSVLPISHNWETSVIESFTFQTEIFTSRSGREQRRAMRDKPRRRVDITAIIGDPHTAAIERVLHTRRAAPIEVPDYALESCVVSQTAPAGTSVLEVVSVPWWATIGGKVVVVYGRKVVENTISNIIGHGYTLGFNEGFDIGVAGTIYLTEPVPHDVTALVQVNGVTEGWVGDPSASYITSAFGQMNLSLDASPPTPILPDESPSATYDGYELNLMRPNFATSLAATFGYAIEALDFGGSNITTFDPVDFPAYTNQLTFLETDRKSCEKIIGNFLRCRGRQGEFLAPTHRRDMDLLATINADAGTIDVTHGALRDTFAAETIHKIIHIRTNTRAITRKITAASPIVGGVRLTLNTPITTKLSLSDDPVISWVHRCRHASDTLTIEWVTPSVARAQYTLTALEVI